MQDTKKMYHNFQDYYYNSKNCNIPNQNQIDFVIILYITIHHF